jgi:GNAT superfamily N-acetyltransferase
VTAAGGVTLREATVDDLAIIMRHRRGMFSDMGFREEAGLAAMEATSAAFMRAGLESGSYRGWLAETQAGIIAGGGVVVVGFPSAPHDPAPRRAWIINMYTEPQYRGRGIGRVIVEAAVAWCRDQGFATVFLHASAAGRHLYEEMGFEPSNEMRLRLA